jgi:hypothetical protein
MSMKGTARAALTFVLTFCCAAAAPAVAQDHLRPSPFLDVSDDSYKKPADSRFLSIYDRLRQRHVLEELRDFLTPLRLPRELKVVTEQCDAQTRPYMSGGPVTICYELIERIGRFAREISPNDTEAQNRAITGAFIQATLHETAHAIFDILEIPIWGRAPDAADRLAALIMVEFGEDVARIGINATIELFKWSANAGKPWTGSDFASTASPDAQRYFNYLCIAAAADPLPLDQGGSIDKKLLPSDRARDCDDEYQQIRKAFNLRIMPYVDAEALTKVKATPWLTWTPAK